MTFKLCVYCASSDVEQRYQDVARDVGVFCADNSVEIVYGGGHLGLMGIVADAALSAGGRVTGVIPEFLTDMEVAHDRLTQLHLTDTMQERQLKMSGLSDAFLILPGGLGTLAEFFEIVAWKSLRLHDKPIMILNVDGYWDDLIAMLKRAREEKFLREEPEDLYTVYRSLQAFYDDFTKISS